jgi:hypothetical protein
MPHTQRDKPFSEVQRDLYHDLLHYAEAQHRTLRCELHLPTARLHCGVSVTNPSRIRFFKSQLCLPDLDFIGGQDEIDPNDLLCFIRYRRRHSDNAVWKTSLTIRQHDAHYYGGMVWSSNSPGCLYRETVLRFSGFPFDYNAMKAFQRVGELASQSQRNDFWHLVDLWAKYRNDKTFLRVWHRLELIFPFRVYLWDWGTLHFFKRLP